MQIDDNVVYITDCYFENTNDFDRFIADAKSYDLSVSFKRNDDLLICDEYCIIGTKDNIDKFFADDGVESCDYEDGYNVTHDAYMHFMESAISAEEYRQYVAM